MLPIIIRKSFVVNIGSQKVRSEGVLKKAFIEI